MARRSGPAEIFVILLVGSLAAAGLYLVGFRSYLLFHGLAEGFSIVVAGGVFLLAWNSRRFLRNDYLIFVGIAYLYVAFLDFVHMLAYEGVHVFSAGGTNLAAQLWLVSRSVEGFSLLAAPLFLRRRARMTPMFAGYAAVVSVLLVLVFRGMFPTCFVEGTGLTPFKKISEYVICTALIAAIVFLYRRRSSLDGSVFRLLLASMAVTVGSELSFTLYTDAFGFFSFVGHAFKIISFYLVYRAIIATGLLRPYDLLFRDLKENEEALLRAHGELERRVDEHTAKLAATGARLRSEVEERKRTEEALLESEEKCRRLVETANDAIFVVSAETGIILEANRRAEELVGLPSDRIIGMHESELRPPEESERGSESLRERIRSGGLISNALVLHRGDGRAIPVEMSASIAEIGGRKIVIAIFRDISERRNLQEQLLQAQKMEAIGRLAGGIAHDFNNAMQVVTGLSSRLLRDLGPDDPLRSKIEQIGNAGDRAAALTRQLLAFGRRQILHPKRLNLNSIVAEMETMLQRVLGEDITVTTALSPELGTVRVDRAQIEQVIMNLALNARDAMLEGGRLVIKTANVEVGETRGQGQAGLPPGSYATLAVSDTGCGMDSEIQSRIFEPFFTTKAPGEGTGLGLSTAYGIVKQSEGHIFVQSEPGRGTTLIVYFPRVEGAAEILPVTPEVGSSAASHAARNSETILLVEDEDAVRQLIDSELRDSGYTVLQARNAGEALLVSQQRAGPISLLFTDVVLPGLSGPRLFEILRPLHPDLRVLYMSGYTERHMTGRGIMESGKAFIEKPFTCDVLVCKVREALDAPQR